MFPGILRKASLEAKPSFFKKNFFGAKPQIKDPDLAGPLNLGLWHTEHFVPVCVRNRGLVAHRTLCSDLCATDRGKMQTQ